MDHNEIRRKILEKLYDAEINVPGDFVLSSELNEELGIPNNVFAFDINYLKEGNFISVDQMHSDSFLADLRITRYGIDIVENKGEFNRQFPLVNITNIQNSSGVIIDSNNTKLSIDNSIHIENSFNSIYDKIDDLDINADEIRERIKLIETELKKDNINTFKIKKSTNWLKKNASWTIFPLIQIIISLYGLYLPK